MLRDMESGLCSFDRLKVILMLFFEPRTISRLLIKGHFIDNSTYTWRLLKKGFLIDR